MGTVQVSRLRAATVLPTYSVAAAADSSGQASTSAVYTVNVGVTPARQSLWDQNVVRPNTAFNYIEAWDGATPLGRLPYKSAEVTSEFVTGNRRNLTASFDPALAGKLYPGVELRPFSGFHYGTGSPEVVPLGRFPLTASAIGLQSAFEIQVSCQDRYQWIMREPFLTPWTTNPNLTIRAQLTALVQDTGKWSAGQISNTITSNAKPGTVLYDEDRSQAIGDLCQAVGAEAFVARDGTFILRNRRTATTPRLLFTTGDLQRVIDAVQTTDIGNVFNTVVILSANTDPAFVIPPVIIQITDPNHPAYPGKIGTISKRIESALFKDVVQARAAGQKILTRISAPAVQWQVVCQSDPSIDESDTIQLLLPAGSGRAQVQTISYPMNGDADQQITTVSTRSDEDFNP